METHKAKAVSLPGLVEREDDHRGEVAEGLAEAEDAQQRDEQLVQHPGVHLAVGESSVILLASPLHSLLKHLLQVEGGAAE